MGEPLGYSPAFNNVTRAYFNKRLNHTFNVMSSLYTYEIQVKQEHIDNSHCDCSHCPIALALSEFFNTPVAVGRVSVNFKACSLPHVILSKTAQDFIHNYDRLGKEAVQPFTFKITLTTKYIDALT